MEKCAYWRFPVIFPKVEKSPLKVEISPLEVEISPLCCEDCRCGKVSEILVQKSWIGDFRKFSGIFGKKIQSGEIST